jgi:hypothetical protein
MMMMKMETKNWTTGKVFSKKKVLAIGYNAEPSQKKHEPIRSLLTRCEINFLHDRINITQPKILYYIS